MIAIVDYQMGNLRSVQKALERVGHEACITNVPDQIATADKLVLPGVGAFGDAMRELRARELVEPIRDFVAGGRPFLGICLGLQLLFEVGEEGGCHAGLAVIPGRVVKFELPPPYKVPHMGWNQVRVRRRSPLLEGVADGAYFYFVHSFYVIPADAGVVALESDYPQAFCAMAWRDNVYATQFHPEKSQADGLRLLKNFGDL